MTPEAVCEPTTRAAEASMYPETTEFSGMTRTRFYSVDADWRQHTIERWTVCIYKDPEDTAGWLTVDVLGLPGVASQGHSRDEAVSNAREAIELALEDGDQEVIDTVRDYEVPAGGTILDVSVVVRRTWRGRPVYTAEDRAKMDCPFPPDPDS